MDATERKCAEEALREAQANLARVSRMTTMGELTASIAHEVNQPLTAVVNNANACISLLEPAPNRPGKTVSNLEDIREALGEIRDDAERASAVVGRVRQLAKRAPVEKSFLDLKDVVRDVLALYKWSVFGDFLLLLLGTYLLSRSLFRHRATVFMVCLVTISAPVYYSQIFLTLLGLPRLGLLPDGWPAHVSQRGRVSILSQALAYLDEFRLLPAACLPHLL